MTDTSKSRVNASVIGYAITLFTCYFIWLLVGLVPAFIDMTFEPIKQVLHEIFFAESSGSMLRLFVLVSLVGALFGFFIREVNDV